MKNWILSTVAILSILSNVSAQDIELEKWTYNGVSAGILSTALSETETGNSFGGSSTFLTVGSDMATFNSTGTDGEGWHGGIINSSYAGSSTGIYQISYDIVKGVFFTTGAFGSGKLQFGWGLRSNVSGTNDCKLDFKYDNKVHYLVVTDATGEKAPIQVGTGTSLFDLKIRQQYNLIERGSPGSFRVFYTLGSASEVELYPGQLTLPVDFQIDEFRLDVPTRQDGNTWGANSPVNIDNLLFTKQDLSPLLTFVNKNVSFAAGGDKGVISGDTYEPGDILQIITTNQNETLVSVTDVSTSLYADPNAFAITPISSNAYPALASGELYTGVFQVEIMDGVTNGPYTFTVTNRINSSSANPTAFSAEF
ncbi:hypothetical protein [Tichowtungia aerotolerans]|uniref:Uncharacterized protein n=1 Tax=Tichowtungia aerotolerans TaxID=2697043 RepID=A0A6P1M4M3_9BACT|nr:hypothetical protein [Tichowtungia aerotolerans]QHI67953.1 hypothetical protein GT409_00315 [Tichowtungia aerotolerans]